MRRFLLLLFAAGLVTTAAAQRSLGQRLDSLLRSPVFETSQVGLMVYDLTADSAVYTCNHRQLMRPASCMKLVTAITALDCLGDHYSYQTGIYYTGTIADSTLRGDIYCVGGFDPLLTEDDVREVALRIRRLGIDSISGRIVADKSMKEDLDYGEGWCWDDDNPQLTPLTIGRKDIFVDCLARQLQAQGIATAAVMKGVGRLPNGSRLICRLEHDISQVLEPMMKKSDNFMAESMFYQTAASAGRRPGKATDTRNITKQLIKKIGLGGNPYKIADGSGLSLYNYVSVELLCRLLRHAWQEPRIYRTLLPSLPVAGVDGTLSERMKTAPTRGNVRAKTGTVTAISSLAGYCTAANGHQLCFAIINQGVLRIADGRNFQDAVCRELCRQ